MVTLTKQRVAVALGNQALSSLTNFLYLLFLIRVLTPEAFGLYSIGFAILLGVGAMVHGFFLIQMVTLLPAIPAADQQDFAAGVLVWLLLGLAASSLLIIGAALFAPALAGYIGALAFTISAYAIKEFFIRYFFSTEKGQLRAMLVHFVLALALSGVVWLSPTAFTAVTALVCYGTAHLAAVICGLMTARLPLRHLSPAIMWQVLAKITPGGRWATVSALIYTIRASAHTFIVAAVVGPLGVAQMNAARVLVTPATIFIPTLSNILLPEFSRVAKAEGFAGVLPRARKASTQILLIATVYSVALLLLWPVVQPMLLGANYADAFWVVVLWCLFAMALALRSGFEWGLQALQHFRQISFINLAGAVATVSAVLGFSFVGGVSGAIAGAILGEVLILCLLFMVMSRLKTGGA